jgi:hypothetical protein
MSDEAPIVMPPERDPRGRSLFWELFHEYEKRYYMSMLLNLRPTDPEAQRAFDEDALTLYFPPRCVTLVRIENQCRALVGPIRRP